MLKLPEKANSQTDTKILLDAISNDKIHLARFILDALDGKIVDSKSEGAQTPLISSVFLPDSHTRCKFLNLLLQRGASVNHQDESGRTALSYACEKGYLDAVKILVKNNADPEMVDTWGNTALMYAAVAGHSLVVEFLVKAFKRLGLQIDRQNKVGNSAVEVAKYLGHTECLSALTCNSKKLYDNSSFTGILSKLNIKKDINEDAESFTGKPSDSPLAINSNTHPTVPLKESSHIDGRVLSMTSGRRKSLIARTRLQSMDSIEEFEKESDSLPSSPQGLVFSGVLTPKPPQRSSVPQSSKQGGQSPYTNNHLPPLSRVEHQLPILYSPRPSKTLSNCCSPANSLSSPLTSPLDILLTPIGKSGNDEANNDKLKKAMSDLGIRRFDDSYYQKRCSLPTSILSPIPPDRSLMPLRKTKTMLKNAASPANTEPMESATQTSKTFSVLGNKLFRRFTFPEFKKAGKEAQEGVCATETRGCERAVRVFPRSETFPLTTNHPQIGSKPSIDSISAVKCEFDFQFKTSSPKSNF